MLLYKAFLNFIFVKLLASLHNWSECKYFAPWFKFAANNPINIAVTITLWLPLYNLTKAGWQWCCDKYMAVWQRRLIIILCITRDDLTQTCEVYAVAKSNNMTKTCHNCSMTATWQFHEDLWQWRCDKTCDNYVCLLLEIWQRLMTITL